MSALLLLAALVAWGTSGAVVYQWNRDRIKGSEAMGRLFCGDGRRIDDVPGRQPSEIIVICRDARGDEVGSRNNFIVLALGLPFFVLVLLATQTFAWRARLGDPKRR